MTKRTTPILNRNDPEKEPLVGNVKVTREDWLNLARDILVHEGVAELKIMSLSDRLGVSRSSFYWYFRNRVDLLAALLTEWEARNTRTIVNYCALPAEDINAAVCNFFRCFIDPALFDRGLDFAVREWARRDVSLRSRMDAADSERLRSVTDMFERYGYPADEADVRARILYFMQLGYHALEVREPMELRMGRLAGFLKGFTGQVPRPELIAEFNTFAHTVGNES